MAAAPHPLEDDSEIGAHAAKLLWLFLFALAIRWVYALIVYAAMGDNGLISADGHGYMTDARLFVELFNTGKLTAGQWLGTDLSTMPVFAWLLAANVMLFGSKGALAYVLLQGVLDSLACLFVYGMAATLRDKFALPAGIAAAINPTQIILAGLVYTDTPFVLFVAVMLFGTLRWLRQPSAAAALIIAAGLGGAVLTRILIAPWAPVLIVLLLLVAAWRHRLTLRLAGHAALIAGVVALCLAPILVRNVVGHKAFALTPQGGLHLAFWVVPLVKEAKDGTPWERTAGAMQKRVKERFPEMRDDPFERSRLTAEVGREALAELGYLAIAKAWIVGAAINIASPAIILSPPVATLPRTGFYGTAGATPVEKVFNFVFRSDNRYYAWALLLGIAGVATLRLMQAIGLIAILRAAPAATLALVLWIGFILAVNGPVGSPKYRLPLEPAFNVMSGAGFAAIRGWWWRRKLLKG